jgi:hypothetical protein
MLNAPEWPAKEREGTMRSADARLSPTKYAVMLNATNRYVMLNPSIPQDRLREASLRSTMNNSQLLPYSQNANEDAASEDQFYAKDQKNPAPFRLGRSRG